MRAPGKIFLIALTAVLGILLVWGVLRAAAGEFGPGGERTRDEPAPNQPAISFIDSPTATCSLPVRGTDTCYIQWQYINVTASTSQYIISSTINIDNRLRAYYAGFFQASMYVPASMNGQGFRVSCGVPGSGGDPNRGRSYSYTLRARETGGLKAANYGTVYCPADQVPLDSAGLDGPATGYQNTTYIFTASAIPITVTQPVTYVWQVTGHPVFTETGGISAARPYTWDTPGVKTVLVTLSNPVSSQARSLTVQISPYTLFLPFQRK